MFGMVIHMRDAVPTEAELDEAAKHLTACLMRLCEALEHRDAAGYSPLPIYHGSSARYWRHKKVEQFYTAWFRNHA